MVWSRSRPEQVNFSLDLNGSTSLGAALTFMVVIPFPRFITRLADTTPHSPDGIMLCLRRQLHLIQCMLLTEQLAALPAIDTPIRIAQPFAAYWIRAGIAEPSLLPVGPRNQLIRFCYSHRPGLRRGVTTSHAGRGRGCRGRFICFEDVKPFEGAVEDGEGLEFLGFVYLRFEPCLHFVLFCFF